MNRMAEMEIDRVNMDITHERKNSNHEQLLGMIGDERVGTLYANNGIKRTVEKEGWKYNITARKSSKIWRFFDFQAITLDISTERGK